MEDFHLLAISPIDGRYSNKTNNLNAYFSEYALFKYRVLVEIEYFIALSEANLPQLKSVDKNVFILLRDIYKKFSIDDAKEIKSIEKETNHDVKAVEYFIKKKFHILHLDEYIEFIHFGLTSQDINNTAIPKSIQDALTQEFYPLFKNLHKKIGDLSMQWKQIPMLTRTHGQPASPTTLGKEFYVFYERLNEQINKIKNIKITSKFGGTTGNFNAHMVAYPKIDWILFANHFVNHYLNLQRSQTTTQIEPYDHLADLCQSLIRINNILIDFCRDIWHYISIDYFKQKIITDEVGSSTMPHKVNPIDFENAEGNLGVANAMLNHFANKLPISRLQRDLTDSTVLRNIGVPFGHIIISFHSILKGLNKIILNQKKLNFDLNQNWAVVAEAIQTILRREKFPNPYETLKSLTRTSEQKITQQSIKKFIETLNVSKKIKNELSQITPLNYTGIIKINYK